MLAKKELRPRRVSTVRAVCAGVAYIALSGGLITFNKHLMRSSRFPHPMALTACHMFVTSLLALILYPICPSLYWSMESTRGKSLSLYKWIIPIGVLKVVMVHCSNLALTKSSVAFLRYIEQWNLALVFAISAVLGLQVVNGRRLAVLIWVIVGGSLCITGEVNFSFAALGVQLIACVAGASAAVMAQVVLQRTLNLDPFTYVNFYAPVGFVFSAVITWARCQPGVVQDFLQWWHLILPNSALAFALNVTTAALIKETSAVGLHMASAVKDLILVVLISDLVFGDPISIRQWICFPLTLCGVLFWIIQTAYEPSAKELSERTALVPRCSQNSASGDVPKGLASQESSSV